MEPPLLVKVMFFSSHSDISWCVLLPCTSGVESFGKPYRIFHLGQQTPPYMNPRLASIEGSLRVVDLIQNLSTSWSRWEWWDDRQGSNKLLPSCQSAPSPPKSTSKGWVQTPTPPPSHILRGGKRVTAGLSQPSSVNPKARDTCPRFQELNSFTLSLMKSKEKEAEVGQPPLPPPL